jgi:hypothetical protein
MRTATSLRLGWTLALCGIAGIALAAPVVKENAVFWNPGGKVDFRATVNGIHEVQADNPMPGLHLDIKANGHALDVYVAPMDFVLKYGIKISKGQDIVVKGMQAAGETGVVAAYEVTVGRYDAGIHIFHEEATYYMRNDAGPFWTETNGPDI